MISSPEHLVNHIGAELRKFTDIAVVGMSGGVDSSTVTALCSRALGAKNVYGVHMPYSTLDSETFNSRSTKLAAHLGVVSVTSPIRSIADEITALVETSLRKEVGQVAKGNNRARARMCTLYCLANALSEQFPGKRVRVIGTGNLSEDYIGYDTKGGDALADLFPIGELFKSEVYQLAQYLMPEEYIDRTPSAGLWVGQTDEKELGHSYDEMEPAIRERLGLHVKEEATSPLIMKFVVDRHVANKHKHEAPPVLRIREYCI